MDWPGCEGDEYRGTSPARKRTSLRPSVATVGHKDCKSTGHTDICASMGWLCYEQSPGKGKSPGGASGDEHLKKTGCTPMM